jgi:hypothetical protein
MAEACLKTQRLAARRTLPKFSPCSDWRSIRKRNSAAFKVICPNQSTDPARFFSPMGRPCTKLLIAQVVMHWPMVSLI